MFEHLLDVVIITTTVLIARHRIHVYKVEKSFGARGTRIREIVESSHVLGVWPSHVKDLTALAGTADDEFIVCVDTLGYGHFAKNKRFLEYFDELEKAAKRGVRVKILVSRESMRKASLNLQFEKEARNARALKRLLRDYHAMYGNLLGVELKSFDDFLKADLFVESHYCTHLVDKLVDKTTSKPVEVAIRPDQQSYEPVYYWMVRRNGIPREMIFAYPRFTGMGTGYALRSHDPELMDSLSSDFNTEWEKATKVMPGIPLYPDAYEKMKARMAAKDKA